MERAARPSGRRAAVAPPIGTTYSAPSGGRRRADRPRGPRRSAITTRAPRPPVRSTDSRSATDARLTIGNIATSRKPFIADRPRKPFIADRPRKPFIADRPRKPFIAVPMTAA
ncbi:Hypothetical protein NTJ_03718 [Nesidiocoris tenuis]|uniref:Uncharacterized protein n=1 Tax=Nesidiocoris tenuis TaxID=355587 RepID=A0ABN7AF55_9HEMI|nr:Hypothetical protein NTJ_03718 [Nesidiocoris tenuis]